MDAVITINMDNAAFEDYTGAELARILRNLASQVDGDDVSGGYYLNLFDANGNIVGELEIMEDN